MARYTGPVCRLCRREGMKLYLKGERCYTPKCGIERRSYAPGQHGQSRKKVSQYGIQLREKQKLRRIYGIVEAQFKNYFLEAERQPGVTIEEFIKLLERRLDNTIYRLGFAASRKQARQLINHGHFLVNGRKVDIPSFIVKPGDAIELKERSKENPFIKQSLELASKRTTPAWLELDAEGMKGKVLAIPSKEEIDTPQLREQLIVEYYSK